MKTFEFSGQVSAAAPGTFPLALPRNTFGAVLMLKNSGASNVTVTVNIGTSVNIKVPISAPAVLGPGLSAVVMIPANFAFLEIVLAGAGFAVTAEIEGGGY